MSKVKFTIEVNRLVNVISTSYKPEKIFIFGSFARGKITSSSDVDFCIIKNSKKTRIERQREVSRLLMDREIPVDIVVYTPSEIKKRMDLGDFFVREIVKNGKLVYDKTAK